MVHLLYVENNFLVMPRASQRCMITNMETRMMLFEAIDNAAIA